MIQVIHPTDPIKTDVLTALIYGEPGIGKSSIAFTSEAPLLLDFDAGLQRTCYRQTAIRVQSWEDVVEFQTSKILTDVNPRTLIIDTVGTMLDNFVANYVKSSDPKNTRRGGEMSLQGYGSMKDVFNQFKNWAKSKRINLIFVAHTTTMEEGDNTKFIPKVTGGSYDILRQECDLIGFVQSNKNQRTIDFSPTDKHIGKNCAELPLQQLPHYSTPEYKTFMQNIVETTLDKMNEVSENQLKATKKINAFIKGLDVIQDLTALNDAIDIIGREADRPIQIQMFTVLKTHAGKIGFEYNRVSKLFEGKK